ncbi:MAG: transcription antitermination factor NusB [Cytophagales bacterium]|jgi:N utilization substance protein B|nr:transcription antitermination factor NusB [Cytophagales bacterium]
MQAVYAYTQAVQSDYQLALDSIAGTFAPDLNSMLPQDNRKLEGSRKLATLLFEENLEAKAVPVQDDTPNEVQKAAADAIDYYYRQCQRDARNLEQTLLRDAEQIYDYYLLSLWLVTELADYVNIDEAEKQNRALKEPPSPPKFLKFAQNAVAQALRDNKNFQQRRIRSGVEKLATTELTKTLFQELKKDTSYRDYQELPETTLEQDWQLVAETVKNVIFKSETALAFWEQTDLNWHSNDDVVRGMFNKTMQFIKEDPVDFPLQKLSADWEADRDFLQKLYQTSIAKFEEYEALIANKTANWDVERVAQVDKVILVMAIAEMLNFPSIPVKVTINEYIELSKVYSTPKSKQFVNGVLDALASDLTTQGILKKSGRGLIDNK